MDKTPQEMVREVNEMMGHTGYQYLHEFDIRDLTKGELSLIYRIAHKVAIRKQYLRDHGISSIDEIPLYDWGLL